MAILNLTSDSFYPASRLDPSAPQPLESAAGAALEAGADILDLGAESTRPGSAPLAPAAEQARLLPALRLLRRRFPHALLSSDTRHAATARAALASGADIINDVSGGADPAMLPLLSESACGIVVTHCRGEFATMHKLPPLADPLATVLAGLRSLAQRAAAAGIDGERVILDPGFGFGKNLDENFPLLAGLDHLLALGFPLLVGFSRKSFLRRERSQGPEARLPASLAAATAAALAGAHIVRTHDVAATREALRITGHLLAHGPRVRRARPADVNAITSLLDANTAAHSGALTGSFPRARVASWVESSMPVMVAELDDQLAGVLVSSDPEAWRASPVIVAMLAAHPLPSGAYLYGPVCIAAAARGRSVLPALYAGLQRLLPGREAILFIRADNSRSLRVHEKLGMHRAASFRFDGAEFAIWSSLR